MASHGFASLMHHRQLFKKHTLRVIDVDIDFAEGMVEEEEKFTEFRGTFPVLANAVNQPGVPWVLSFTCVSVIPEDEELCFGVQRPIFFIELSARARIAAKRRRLSAGKAYHQVKKQRRLLQMESNPVLALEA